MQCTKVVQYTKQKKNRKNTGQQETQNNKNIYQKIKWYTCTTLIEIICIHSDWINLSLCSVRFAINMYVRMELQCIYVYLSILTISAWWPHKRCIHTLYFVLVIQLCVLPAVFYTLWPAIWSNICRASSNLLVLLCAPNLWCISDLMVHYCDE